MTMMDWQQVTIPLTILLLAYWRQDSWLYLASGAFLFYTGITFVGLATTTGSIIGIGVMVVGVYTIVRAFLAGSWK